MARSPRTSAVARRVPWLVLAVVLAVALFIGSRPDSGTTTEDRVRSIAATIKCPKCAGQSAATSDAPTAAAIRADIARRLERRESADQIRDYYASRYDDILLTPQRSGAGSLVWAVPVVVVVAAFAGLGFAFHRWRVSGTALPTAGDRDLVAAAMSRARTDGPPGDEPPADGPPADGPPADGHGEGEGR